MLFLLQNILFLDRQNHSSFTGVLPAVHKDPLRNKLTAQINFHQNNLDVYTESQFWHIYSSQRSRVCTSCKLLKANSRCSQKKENFIESNSYELTGSGKKYEISKIFQEPDHLLPVSSFSLLSPVSKGHSHSAAGSINAAS